MFVFHDVLIKESSFSFVNIQTKNDSKKRSFLINSRFRYKKTGFTNLKVLFTHKKGSFTHYRFFMNKVGLTIVVS